jgi:putative tryptophan/tyrosine transport system substrate-binding protein
MGKRLQLLKEVAPGMTRVAVLWQPDHYGEGTVKIMTEATEAAARALAVRLQRVEARSADDLAGAFGAMTEGRADALLVWTSAMFLSERKRIVDFAAKSRIPAVYPWRQAVDAGGLIGYGPSPPDVFRRAAIHVDKILKGAKPGDLPVEQPSKFELVINLKTAKALGLTIPQPLLLRADHVIE